MPTTENKGSNSAEDDMDKYLADFWHEKNGGLCPVGQVPHGTETIVCCLVKVCGPGMIYIALCSCRWLCSLVFKIADLQT